MFLLNSCLGQFSAAWSPRHSFSRSYGVILPSSLTMLLPSALGFSPHLPVSVYGTGTMRTIAAFLDAWLTCFPTSVRSASRLWIVHRICLMHSYPACTSLSIPGSCLLTQSRSALLWKPWIFGRKDSHLPLATHSGILSSIQSTAPYRYCFFPYPMLLYQSAYADSQASAVCFSPGHFRRRTSRLVSYYALFECMAASEPTS